MLLNVNNLSFGYGKKDVLKNISFSINEGEFISVIGENGSGKSTLFKVINGILNGYKGKIEYKEIDVKKIKRIDFAKEVAVLYQNTKCSFPFTCLEVVSMGLYPHKNGFGKLNKNDMDFIKYIMELTNTINIANCDIRCLSGGQTQKVFLAKALAQKPKLLFLDEAMSGFDISAKIKMTNILKNMCKKENIAVVSIQHDIDMAFAKSDKIIALKNGEVNYFAEPKDLLNKKFFREIFNVDIKIENNEAFHIIL